MSNLIKKTKEIILNDKKYIMCFDMTSVNMFQELTGMSFLNALHLINRYDDKTLLNFMACSIRPIDEPETPIGEELFDFNIIGLLLAHTLDVIELVSSSMPQENKKKRNTKKKTVSKEEVDVDYLYYMYVTVLNRSERDFWSSTLRKVISQINMHIDLHNKSNGELKNQKSKNKDYEVLKVI